MTDTPNNGYNRPEKGETNWHVDLNENFASIDADVEIRDTEANKGDYKPKSGAKYLATDTGAVYQGDGSSWALDSRKVSTIDRDNLKSKPIWVGNPFSDKHEYVGYDDLATAFGNLPWQAEVYIHGNVTVGETLAPDNSYLYLHGHGGYNRSNEDGMPSIVAESGFTGDHLIDLDGIGSKWGSIEKLNLFCEGNVANGITTGRADNGLIRDIALYRASGDHLIEVRNGAFDNIIDRCQLNGKDETDYGIRFWEPNEGQNGGNEPKLYSSLIRAYNEAGAYINNIGSVGPRIVDTSFRGGGPDNIAGKYGIVIDNGGNTRQAIIDRCQFETHSEAGIFYDGTKDPLGGAVCNFSVSRSTFNPQAQISLKMEGKAGNVMFGPFNLIGADTDISTRSGSPGAFVGFMNYTYSNDDPYVGFDWKGNYSTFIEPLVNSHRFQMGGSEKLEWGDSQVSGNKRTAQLVQNRVQVSDAETADLFQSRPTLGSFVVTNNDSGHVAEFINAGDPGTSNGHGLTLTNQDASEYSDTQGNSGTVNIYWDGSLTIQNNSGSGGEFQVIAQQSWTQ